MFDREKCDLCGECLVKCLYVDYDLEKAKNEFAKLVRGESSPILAECITCVACNQYCTKDAKPFDLINKLQEETGLFKVSEKSVHELTSTEKQPTQIIRGEPGKPVISLCVVGDIIPHQFEGKMFEGATFLKGGEFFCKIGYIHIGKPSWVEAGAKKFIDKLNSLGFKEIVFYHDDCNAMMEKVKEFGLQLNFKPIHIIEYLLNYLKQHKDQIQKLNLKIAYQQPCASRYTPWKDPMLDELFSLIGVERVKRKYDRMNALCCGAPIAYTDKEKTEKIRNLNIQDAKEAGAEAMVFLCPICVLSLRRKAWEAGLEPYTIINLCRLALGEELPAGGAGKKY